MIPGIAIPSAVQPPPQPAALTALTSDVAIGRMPFSAVGGTVAIAEVINNTQGNGQLARRMAASTANSAPAPLASSSTLGASPTVGFSSLFVAQLLGQNTNGDSDLIASFFSQQPASIALDNETLVQFSRVIYKPSYASLPLPPQPMMQLAPSDEPTPLDTLRSQMMTSPAQDVARMETARISSPVSTVSFASNAGLVEAQAGNAVLPVQSPRTAPRPASNSNSVDAPRQQPQQPRSLIQSSGGLDAYMATISRNAANLNVRVQAPVKVAM